MARPEQQQGTLRSTWLRAWRKVGYKKLYPSFQRDASDSQKFKIKFGYIHSAAGTLFSDIGEPPLRDIEIAISGVSLENIRQVSVRVGRIFHRRVVVDINDQIDIPRVDVSDLYPTLGCTTKVIVGGDQLRTIEVATVKGEGNILKPRVPVKDGYSYENGRLIVKPRRSIRKNMVAVTGDEPADGKISVSQAQGTRSSAAIRLSDGWHKIRSGEFVVEVDRVTGDKVKRGKVVRWRYETPQQ